MVNYHVYVGSVYLKNQGPKAMTPSTCEFDDVILVDIHSVIPDFATDRLIPKLFPVLSSHSTARTVLQRNTAENLQLITSDERT